MNTLDHEEGQGAVVPGPAAGELSPWQEWCLGVGLSVVSGALLSALASVLGSFGWSFVLGVPIVMGAIFGYVSRPGRALLIFGSIFVVSSMIFALIVMEVAGLLCGLTAGSILMFPTMVGAFAGSALRRHHVRPLGTVSHLLLLGGLLGASGSGLVLESRLPRDAAEESISTRRLLPIPSDEAWSRMVFYEDVPLEPPLLARIGLPHPLRTEGVVRRVGDVKRCVYTKGYLRKRITRMDAGRRLEFEVIEQHSIEDRSVDLLRGSFAFEPRPDGGTLVTVTTVYRPLLSARAVWRPFERALAGALHDHVLDGMLLRRQEPDVADASILGPVVPPASGPEVGMELGAHASGAELRAPAEGPRAGGPWRRAG